MRFLLSLFALMTLTPFTAAGDKPAVVLKHEGWVAAVAFAPDGKTLASAGADNVVRLWEVGTWKAKGVIETHTDCVCAIAFSPTSTLVLSGSFDSTLKRSTFEGKAFGPSINSTTRKGPVLAVAARPGGGVGFVASGGVEGIITLRMGTKIARLKGHKSWINSLNFNSDGSMLASGSSDGTARLWDTSKLGGKMPFAPEIGALEGGAGEVRSVAFSPDGKLLAAGNRYHTVRVWDVASKKEVTTLTGHMSDVWSIAFSPDGKTLAAADTDWKKPSKVKLWDTTTWKERGAFDVPGEILSIAYSPNGEWLAVGSWDKTVRVFSLK